VRAEQAEIHHRDEKGLHAGDVRGHSFASRANARGRFKSEGEFQSPIALRYTPAYGSGDGGGGSFFALNPDAKG